MTEQDVIKEQDVINTAIRWRNSDIEGRDLAVSDAELIIAVDNLIRARDKDGNSKKYYQPDE